MTEPLHPLRNRFWIAALRGAFAIVMGLTLFYWPSIKLAELLLWCGVYAVADGVMISIVGLAIRWWSLPLVGLAGLALGLFLLSRPAATEAVILFAVAAFAMVRGAFDVAVAFDLRREIPDEWLLLAKGTLLFLFGVLLSSGFAALVTLFPAGRVLVLAWMIGVFAVVEGTLLLLFADRVRRTDRLARGVTLPRLQGA